MTNRRFGGPVLAIDRSEWVQVRARETNDCSPPLVDDINATKADRPVCPSVLTRQDRSEWVQVRVRETSDCSPPLGGDIKATKADRPVCPSVPSRQDGRRVGT